MHKPPAPLARAGFVAGAALLAAACGGGGDTPAEANAVIDANVMLEQIGNDASAIESAYNAVEPLPAENGGAASNEANVAGETEGGDTGGNTLDTNVAGM